MAGTLVRDADEVDLLDDVDLATDATDTGTAVYVGWPGTVKAILTTGTVAGTNNVVLQACETSDFTTADVRTLFTFDVTVDDDDTVFESPDIQVNAKYVRAVATVGTGGDMTATTLYLRPAHYHETLLDSTDDLA